MKNINVLIIEDHQLLINNYISAFSLVKNKMGGVNFRINQAVNINEAIEELENTKSSSPFDLVFLDIKLPGLKNRKVRPGEDIGIRIKKEFPKTKIIICTFYNDNFRIGNLIELIDPDALLIKGDIKNLEEIALVIYKVLHHECYYSKTVIELMRKKMGNPYLLDNIDRHILYELSNGAKMKELLELIPLSKSGIEKRMRSLRGAFNIESHSIRDLVIIAKAKGFI